MKPNDITPSPMQESQKDSDNTLRQLLDRLPANSVWHDILDAQGNCLCQGTGDPDDGMEPVLTRLNFKEKTLLDLGCNTGYNSFLALRNGARHVIGVDSDPLLIQVARLLAEKNGHDCVDFIEGCLHDVPLVSRLAADRKTTLDMVLLVDFIGKGHIRKGKLASLLGTLKQHGSREIVLTVRPLYRIRKHFGMSEEEFRTTHPTSRIRGKHYFAALDIVDSMGADWELISPMVPTLHDEDTKKILLHFLRK